MCKYIFVRLLWIIISILILITVLYITVTLVMIHTWSFPHPFIDDFSPAITRYIQYIKGIITEWDWGKVYLTDKSVWDVFFPKIPVTLKLNFISFLFYIPIGITLGVISALKKNKKTDRIISVITLLFVSLPSFIFILLLVLLFGAYLDWLPLVFPARDTNTTYRLLGLILPVIALSVGPIALLTRLVRGELSEALASDYVLLAITKGLSKRQAILRHALRNSMVPILPMILASFVTILTGSFFIEYVYQVPGAARLFLQSLSYPYLNVNLIIICAVFFSIITLVVALIVDIAYNLIDPRVRIGSKKF